MLQVESYASQFQHGSCYSIVQVCTPKIQKACPCWRMTDGHAGMWRNRFNRLESARNPETEQGAAKVGSLWAVSGCSASNTAQTHFSSLVTFLLRMRRNLGIINVRVVRWTSPRFLRRPMNAIETHIHQSHYTLRVPRSSKNLEVYEHKRNQSTHQPQTTKHTT